MKEEQRRSNREGNSEGSVERVAYRQGMGSMGRKGWG